MKKIFAKNLILFLFGACIYTSMEILFRNYSDRLMFLVGGIAIVLLDKINEDLSMDMPLVLQMILGGIIITFLEAVSGVFALKVLHIRIWDYSNQWGACLYNLVCPLFSFIWCLLSGVGIILADAINYYVLHDAERPYYRKLNGEILWIMPNRICGGGD